MNEVETDHRPSATDATQYELIDNRQVTGK